MRRSLALCGSSAVLAFAVACGGGQSTDEDVETEVEQTEEDVATDPVDQPESMPEEEPTSTADPVDEPEPEIEEEPAEQPPYAVAEWDTIVSTYVTDDGGFRYEALLANADHVALLATVTQSIADTDPSTWERDEQLAFYINAYNANTIELVLEEWEVDSVLEEDGFFDDEDHMVAGEEMTLNELENEIIRAEFGEPRIHFLVNCASTGCPPLASYAFTAENLEEAFETHTRAYIQRTSELNRDRGRVYVSQIFEWFEDDFDVAGGVRAFLVQYFDGEDAEFVANEENSIRHFEYDWSINARD